MQTNIPCLELEVWSNHWLDICQEIALNGNASKCVCPNIVSLI